MYVWLAPCLDRALTLPSGIYVNLDPAAEDFDFEPDVDIKNLISLDDAMEEMQLGPNGAMMACFECAPPLPTAAATAASALASHLTTCAGS